MSMRVRTPILEAARQAVAVTFSQAGRDSFTGQEMAFDWELAQNSGRYAREYARFAERRAHRWGEEPPSAP
jgi:hypothetical protein